MSSGKTTTKKPLDPQAAKILEQYRNAGKGIPAGEGGGAGTDGAGGTAPAKPTAGAPASPMRRSGTRGK